MLGLIAVGIGVSVLPHFTAVERFENVVWKPLLRPVWHSEWALVWRPAPDAPVVPAFIDLAEHRFPTPKPPLPEF
jgi:DNA-binding transcriptional LysR family regulator